MHTKHKIGYTRLVNHTQQHLYYAIYVCLCAPSGRSEGIPEKLKSIVAQFEFQHVVKQWEEKGVNFRYYLYVPEIHPDTGEVFCERAQGWLNLHGLQYNNNAPFCI